MRKDILIIGQGISGTILSWFLHKHGVSFRVMDSGKTNASKISGGIINPVTGRRVVTAWMDDVMLPFAEATYKEIEGFLNTDIIAKTAIINFFPNPFMRESFIKKINQQAPYISLADEELMYNQYFTYEFSIGKINPAYIVHTANLLDGWKNYLLKQQKITIEFFDFAKLNVKDNNIFYEGLEYSKIIFCDGVEGNTNPFFSMLPFALNKGEALIIEAKDLPVDFIYKKSITLVPLLQEGFFWAGTNYIWDFENDYPTEDFRTTTEQALKSWLKVPFTTVDHKAAVRPATVERRPFVGFHPVYKNIGILNGMGTKGCSLAPYFAHQLTQNIINNEPILPEADIKRHARILERTSL